MRGGHLLTYCVTYTLAFTIVQALSCRLLNAEDRIQFQGHPHRIYVDKMSLGQAFLRIPQLSSSNYYLMNAPFSHHPRLIK